MPQKIFNPPPQFSRLGTLCPTLLLLVCSFHGMGVSWVLSPPFCLFASVLYTYNSMYIRCVLHICMYIVFIYIYMYMCSASGRRDLSEIVDESEIIRHDSNYD